MSTLMKNRPCAQVCDAGPAGSVELVLLRRLLGLCLRMSLTLSADCPARKGG
ncbi:hypothetical protein AB0M38_21120 [Streptomyces sp. NPDC051742]|uniref:hypothetical protein n=1 Tax=unclassified Streptomyces TaxID=2593676 RepID=UPI00343A7587